MAGPWAMPMRHRIELQQPPQLSTAVRAGGGKYHAWDSGHDTLNTEVRPAPNHLEVDRGDPRERRSGAARPHAPSAVLACSNHLERRASEARSSSNRSSSAAGRQGNSGCSNLVITKRPHEMLQRAGEGCTPERLQINVNTSVEMRLGEKKASGRDAPTRRRTLRVLHVPNPA